MVVNFTKAQPTISFSSTNLPMTKNHKPLTTVTKSISFDDKVFMKIEARRLALRLDRSTSIRFVMEDRLGILKRPLLDEADDCISGVQYNLIRGGPSARSIPANF